MIYSDKNIKVSLKTDGLVFIPNLEDEQIGPASIDLRLNNVFKKLKNEVVIVDTLTTILKEDDYEIYNVDNNGFVLQPQEFVLACTKEYVNVPDNLLLRMEGKSTLARMGLMIHTAGFIDPGFEGTLTLEISNHSNLPIRLYPDMYICQVVVEQLLEKADIPYDKRKKSLYNKYNTPGLPKINNLF